MPDNKYYIIINDQQLGPYEREVLPAHGLTAETPVWREGLEGWLRASELPELSYLLGPGAPYSQEETQIGGQPLAGNTAAQNALPPQEEYYAIIADIKMGPAPLAQLARRGMNLDSPVWKPGMPDWQPAYTLPEVAQFLQSSGQGMQPPQGGFQQPQQPPFQPKQPLQQPYQQPPYTGGNQGVGCPIPHTNWMPWAIVGTVLGSGTCVALITGIIAIIYADKANSAYNRGDQLEGDQKNSTAKTLTIITLALVALSFIFSLVLVMAAGLESGY